jgi:hypothetical protein
MSQLYREERIKLTPNDYVEIDGVRRTALSWTSYDVVKLKFFLDKNQEYSPTQSLKQIIKKQLNAGNAKRKDSA